jgi:predicted phage-related endonuclease
MSTNEIISKIEAMREWESLIANAQEEADTLRDSIKAEMEQRDLEELEAGAYIVRWTSVLSNRFDSSAFKKAYADLYKSFTKQVASRRFSISV